MGNAIYKNRSKEAISIMSYFLGNKYHKRSEHDTISPEFADHRHAEANKWSFLLYMRGLFYRSQLQ